MTARQGQRNAKETNTFFQTSGSQEPGFRNSRVLCQFVCSSDDASVRPTTRKTNPLLGTGDAGGAAQVRLGSQWGVSRDRMLDGTVLNK